MDLTTYARVKVMIEGAGGQATLPTTATLTTYIGRIITDWSARAESLMDRRVTTATYTEYLDARPGQRVFSLRAYPVTSVVSVTEDTAREFTGATVAATDYSCMTGAGLLRMDGYHMTGGPGSVKVVYVGGMAASVATFAASYPDIAGAVEMQVAYAFERRANFGRESASAGQGSVSYPGALDWLPASRWLLMRYRRVTLG